MTSVPLPTLRRTAAAVNARRYAIACVCLLVVAVALRFYGLAEYALLYDETRAALNSRGTLPEVLDNTRRRNSSPILYPIALWAVQKAASTEFSVRLMPAAASALTVAALLFWMPRLGVARRAAFLAALLAALSAPAIEHAQGAREYSVDVLLAALMIVGLLQYLQDGKRALLSAALFVAPLLQYGLILFGAATLAVAAIEASSQTPVCGARQTYGAAIWEWMKQRIDLLLPIACFATACFASWALTARYQWTAGGWNSVGYLADYYYKSGFDAAAIVEFALNRTWGLLIYHLPMVIAPAALLAFGALLLSSLKRRRFDTLALLALFAIGVSLCAALISLYPLGGLHQHLYMGPIIFLAAGNAFHSLAEDAAAAARRAWLAPALAVAAAIMITLVGAAAIRQQNYYTANNIKAVLAALDAREREGDGVYVYRWAVPFMEFYKGEKPANYFYEQTPCLDHTAASLDCVPEALDKMFRVLFNGSRRIWLIHNVNVPVSKEIAAYSQEIVLEEIASGGWNALYLMTGFDEVVANVREEGRDMHDAVAPGAPSVVSNYNLYLQDNALYYAKQPCALADTEAKFFLHIYPTDAADLPAYGGALENLDFDFLNYGFLTDDKCIIRRDLPDYPIDRIHTGQYIYPDGAVTWETDLPFNP